MDLRVAEHTQYRKIEKPKDHKRSPVMCCCHMITGGVLLGLIQLVVIVSLLAASALMLDRWRRWERLPYDPDWQTQTMATTTLKPYVPYNYKFRNTERVEIGWVMTLQSTVASTASQFSISLSCDLDGSRDAPFYFEPRFSTTPNFVARNTRRNTVFDKNEEQDGGMGGLARSAAFVIRIEVFAGYYEVSMGIGGAAMAKFIKYAHRTEYSCIKSVQIQGDVLSPFSVQYYWATGSSYADIFASSWLEFCLTHHVTFLAVWLVCMFPYMLVFILYDGVYIIPNLSMTILNAGATFMVLLALSIRVGWPATRYETDGVEEGFMVYAIVALIVWMFVMLGFAYFIYKFYRWMNDEYWVAHRAHHDLGTVTLAAQRKEALPLGTAATSRPPGSRAFDSRNGGYPDQGYDQGYPDQGGPGYNQAFEYDQNYV